MKKTIGMVLLAWAGAALAEQDPWKPCSPPCTERENVFAFTEKPAAKNLGNDRYEIAFAVKGNCDATVGIIDEAGKVVRHLASGVLGANAPDPFAKNSLKQTVYWNGKDDLDDYVKEPGSLRVRVSLGLNPTFEKRLGGSSPHNVPGIVWAMAAAPDGVYAISVSAHFGRCYLRVFDHDGNYMRSLIPPPANLPESKLGGWGYVEYEPGRKALQAHNMRMTLNSNGEWLTFKAGRPDDCQPVIAGDKLYFADSGKILKAVETSLHYVRTDGSSDVPGIAGRPLTWPLDPAGTPRPRLAASPDGRWLYLATGPGTKGGGVPPLVFRAKADETGMAEPFLGAVREQKGGKKTIEPGSDNRSFQAAAGIACDSKGRIYVADEGNNRIQVYSPEGEYIKTVSVDRPQLVQVHRRTGSIYVLHQGREKGKSVDRLTKFASFENPKEEYHVDDFPAATFAVDSWTAKPRLWTAGGRFGYRSEFVKSIEVYEEDGGTCRKILDFDEMAAKSDGAQYIGRWHGQAGKVVCDTARNRLYYGSAGKNFPTPAILDLDTGEHLGDLKLGVADDIAFDKKGYMHCHFNPMFFMPGVGRLDPERVSSTRGREGSSWRYVPNRPYLAYGEVPYDYGILPDGEGPAVSMAYAGTSHFGSIGGKGGWQGILPVKDQGGCKAFQDGIGVNMRGDVAEQCNIYYVPKMEDDARSYAMQGSENLTESGTYNEEQHVYTAFLRSIEDSAKKGEETYSIKRRPGVPLSGGTVWTFDSSGELRDACAALAGDLVNGAQMDENGDIYFVNARVRAVGEAGAPFLFHKSGVFGDPTGDHIKWNRNPLTGTLIKARGKDAHMLLANSAVPLSEAPDRPPDLIATDWPDDGNVKAVNARAWIEGARWLYAGAGPIVFQGCSCPTMRFHTDWYKRTFVPEAYRHSIGVLDTDGNLILHIGQYGNLDSADGPKARIPVGGDGIGITFVRFVGGTDDRLVFDNHGEQIVSLKLNYHAEETVPIATK